MIITRESMKKPTSYEELSDYQFDRYQEYIMDNGDNSEVIICNGDTLLKAAEDGYLLDEFLATIAK